MRSGTVYQLPNLAHTITEIGSGLLPTPTATPYGRNKSASKGAAVRPSLSSLVTQKNFYPTPRSCSAMAANLSEKMAMHPHNNLEVAIARKMLPTPCARDYKGARSKESLALAGRDGSNSLPDAFAISGQSAKLNPQFVEVLMGFPIMHTDLNA